MYISKANFVYASINATVQRQTDFSRGADFDNFLCNLTVFMQKNLKHKLDLAYTIIIFYFKPYLM